MRLIRLFWFFSTIIIIFPVSLGVVHPTSKNLIPHFCLHSKTEFDIKAAQITYYIRSKGYYDCWFQLDILGNEKTAEGNTTGVFIISNNLITDLALYYSQNTPLNYSLLPNGTHTFCFFILDFPIPDNTYFQIYGDFKGQSQEYTSQTHIFHFGITWGEFCESQITTVIIGQTEKVIQIIPIFDEASGDYSQFSWIQSQVSGFSAVVEVASRNPAYLETNITDWEGNPGDSFCFYFRNAGPFRFHIWILIPAWIQCNLSSVCLMPNQSEFISFTLRSNIVKRLEGTIEIISEELDLNLETNVVVLLKQRSINPILLLGLSITCFCGVFLLIYQKDVLMKYIKKSTIIEKIAPPVRAKTVSKSMSDVTWESIQHRWKPFLQDRELKILEILYFKGDMNQKALAQELNLPKSTVSRIVSRLESKRLLYREPFGISNIIKLNNKMITLTTTDDTILSNH